MASVGIIMTKTLPFVGTNTTIKTFRHALSLDEVCDIAGLFGSTQPRLYVASYQVSPELLPSSSSQGQSNIFVLPQEAVRQSEENSDRGVIPGEKVYQVSTGAC